MPPAPTPSTARSYGGISAADRVANRRERLLEAGLERYGTYGWAATGVKDICREAGLTDRYFYESFPDAVGLFTAVFDRATERLLVDVAEAVAMASARPRDQIRAAIGTFVRALADDRRTARMIFIEAAAAGGEAEAHMRTTLRRFAALIVTTARPHVAPGIPDRVLLLGGLALVGAIERVMVEWQDGELDTSMDQLIHHLTELFVAAGPAFGLPAAS